MSGDTPKSKGRSSTQIVAELTTQLFELQRSDDFEVLGIDRTADDETLRLAYLELSKRYHPHRFAKYRSSYSRVGHPVSAADARGVDSAVHNRRTRTASQALLLLLVEWCESAVESDR